MNMLATRPETARVNFSMNSAMNLVHRFRSFPQPMPDRQSKTIVPHVLLLPLLAGGLTSCATVPLPGKGVVVQQSVRPVKPLLEGREGELTVTKPKPSPSAAGTAKSKSARTKAGAKPADAAIAAKLTDAENKASSALSMSQSAQTEEDWHLVVQQWRKAIAVLPTRTENSSLSDEVTTARSTYNQNLQAALARSKSAGNPAPSQPIVIDRERSGQSRGLVLGGEASPSPSASPNPSASPSIAPDAPKSPAPAKSTAPSRKN